jgi:hypothetical protein
MDPTIGSIKISLGNNDWGRGVSQAIVDTSHIAWVPSCHDQRNGSVICQIDLKGKCDYGEHNVFPHILPCD